MVECDEYFMCASSDVATFVPLCFPSDDGWSRSAQVTRTWMYSNSVNSKPQVIVLNRYMFCGILCFEASNFNKVLAAVIPPTS